MASRTTTVDARPSILIVKLVSSTQKISNMMLIHDKVRRIK